MDCSLPGSSIHGIFQAKVLSGVPLPSLIQGIDLVDSKNSLCPALIWLHTLIIICKNRKRLWNVPWQQQYDCRGISVLGLMKTELFPVHCKGPMALINTPAVSLMTVTSGWLTGHEWSHCGICDFCFFFSNSSSTIGKTKSLWVSQHELTLFSFLFCLKKMECFTNLRVWIKHFSFTVQRMHQQGIREVDCVRTWEFPRKLATFWKSRRHAA